MRGPVSLSILLHATVILIAWLGLPSFTDQVIETPPLIDVAVITDLSQAPEALREPMPQPKEEKPAPPVPKQQASVPKPPAPPPPGLHPETQ